MLHTPIKRMLVITCVFMRCLHASVHWNIHTDPVVFNGDVILFCNTSSVQSPCTQCTWRWYGGQQLALLSFNGYTIDDTKYFSHVTEDGFGLVIRNFSTEDINVPYSCSFGFDSHLKELTMKDHYELQPTNRTINKNYSMEGNSMLNVHVDFQMVHPPPNCTIHFNNENVTAKLISHKERKGLFYSVVFKLQHDVKSHSCRGRIHLQCQIGSQRQSYIKTDIGYSCYDEMLTNKIYISFIIVGLLLVAIIVLIVCHRHGHATCLNNNKHDNECHTLSQHKSSSINENKTREKFVLSDNMMKSKMKYRSDSEVHFYTKVPSDTQESTKDSCLRKSSSL